MNNIPTYIDLANRVTELIQEKVALRNALNDAVSLIQIPEHAWDTEEDARLAKCVAVLAQHSP